MLRSLTTLTLALLVPPCDRGARSLVSAIELFNKSATEVRVSIAAKNRKRNYITGACPWAGSIARCRALTLLARMQ